jgi:hypothetical protein
MKHVYGKITMQIVFILGLFMSGPRVLALDSSPLPGFEGPPTEAQMYERSMMTAGGVRVPTSGETGLSEDSVIIVLMRLVNVLLMVFGAAAVIAFIVAGFQYLLAGGDESAIKTAKRNVQYALYGIIVALSGAVVIYAIDALLAPGAVTYF